jgi:hypothetical protein
MTAVSCADALGLRQVIDDRPAGDVEARAELQAVQHPEDPIDAHAGAEAPLLQIGEAALGLLGLAKQEARLGVEVERQHGRGSPALRPGVTHRSSPPRRHQSMY